VLNIHVFLNGTSARIRLFSAINPLDSKGNYSATSNNKNLVKFITLYISIILYFVIMSTFGE